MSTLPAGIQRELDAAEQRTGWTRALDTAAQRLYQIVKMTPEEFQRYSAAIYDKLS